VEILLDHALRAGDLQESQLAVKALVDMATPRAAEAGLRATSALPERQREPYRTALLATLGR
jgi:hypothetical protein